MAKGKNVDKLARPAGKKPNPNVSDDNPVEFAKSIENIGSGDNGEGQKEEQIIKKEEVGPVETEKVTQVETDQKATDSSKAMIDRVNALMAEGKTMEEAMQLAVEELLKAMPAQTVAGRTILDADGLISRMKGETNIEALKHRIKIAYAKKSKSAGKASEAKYDLEIKAGQARLNELIKECDSVEDPIERINKYIEYGEATGTVLQSVLKHLEQAADKKLEGIREKLKMTVKSQKEAINQAPSDMAEAVEVTLKSFKVDFVTPFVDRLKRNDVRCITINKEYNFIAAIEKMEAAKVEAATQTTTEAQQEVAAGLSTEEGKEGTEA